MYSMYYVTMLLVNGYEECKLFTVLCTSLVFLLDSLRGRIRVHVKITINMRVCILAWRGVETGWLRD